MRQIVTEESRPNSLINHITSAQHRSQTLYTCHIRSLLAPKVNAIASKPKNIFFFPLEREYSFNHAHDRSVGMHFHFPLGVWQQKGKKEKKEIRVGRGSVEVRVSQ